MNKKKETKEDVIVFSWRVLWIKKIFPTVIMVSIGAIAKGGFDVWAFHVTNKNIAKTVRNNEEEIIAVGSALEQKADKSEVTELNTRIRLIQSGLCIIDKRTCSLKKED